MDAWERAESVLVGGVSAPARSFRAVGGGAFVAKSAHGAHLVSTEGRKYLDYYLSQGSVIFGHGDEDVTSAVVAAARNGATFGLTSDNEIALAETITQRIPGIERVRFTVSGSDATAVAIRIARGETGRDTVVRFAGGYHGNANELLQQQDTNHVSPTSTGLAQKPVDQIVPFNIVPELDDAIAAVIVEPVACNMGLVLPEEGFLQGLRDACTRVGAVLIFDEVITGFRVGPSGASGALGVTPDLWCFGKVIGGGLPLAAVGGSATLMNELSPLGSVYAAGTMAANPVAVAAGLATLNKLNDSAYEMLHGRAVELANNLRKVAESVGIDVQVPVFGGLVGLLFSPEPVTSELNTEQRTIHEAQYAKFFQAMLGRGVLLPPTPYSPLYLSLAHTWEDIDWTTDIAAAAMAAAI